MLGAQEAFAALSETLAQGNDAAWLRRELAETGTLTDVVRKQAALWSG